MKNSLIILFLVVSAISCRDSNNNQHKNDNIQTVENHNEISLVTDNNARIQSSKVCFVNNQYMGIKQIPVEYEGKTYYGCCEGCVLRLKQDRTTRYGIDPRTGNEVDKASAFIVLNPNGNNSVYYFETEKSYLKYFGKS